MRHLIGDGFVGDVLSTTLIARGGPLQGGAIPHLPPTLTRRLGALGIPAFTRVTRAARLSLAEREFVTAARALGATDARILLQKLMPNAALPLLAYFLIGVAVTIVVEDALSFLRLDMPPPAPSWGIMIGESRETLEIAPALPCARSTV